MSRKPRRPSKPRPQTKADLLAREQETWDELAATWRRMPESALVRPGACGPEWSVKDVMNHVAAWMEAALRVIPELGRGRRATLGHGTNTFNALEQARSKVSSLAASRRRLNSARRELLALVKNLPTQQALDPNGRIGWWIKFSTYAHYGEHIYELTEFRKRRIKK